MIRRILIAPNPILNKIAEPISDNEFGKGLDKVLSDMAETMYANNGVGLAAQQIGLLKRLVVVDIGQRYGVDLIKMVNPVIKLRSGEISMIKEGCLSLPSFSANIKRPKRIEVAYFDSFGNEKYDIFDGIASHIVQHEVDHLDGITLLKKANQIFKKQYLKRVKKYKKAAPDLMGVLGV